MIGKDNVEEILLSNIEDINKEKLYPLYKSWREGDYADFLDTLTDYLTDKLFFDECFYSYDSDKVELVKSKVIEWFGEDNGLALIDDEYWLLSYAFTDEGTKFWDILKIDTVDLEKAKKLVKLMSITEEIRKKIEKNWT